MTLPKGHTVFYPIGRALDASGHILIESDKAGTGGIKPDVNIENSLDTLQRQFVKNEDIVLARGQAVLADMIAGK